MLAVFVLCFCVASLLALDNEADILSAQDTSSQAPPINIEALPLDLYRTNNVGNKMPSSNPFPREEMLKSRRASTINCPTTDILLKILNILTNLLQESSHMFEPGKLQYLLTIIKKVIEKSSITDGNYKVNNDLNNLDAQLEKLNAKNKENALRDNDNKFQAKASLQSEIPRPENLECQYIFNLLVKFINNAYTQVDNYCKLTGKCDANALSLFNFDNSAHKANPYNQHNIFSYLTQRKQLPPSAKTYLPSYNRNILNIEKGNSYIDVPNQPVKQDYRLILQNYLKNLNQNNVQGLPNAYTLGNLPNSLINQDNYAKDPYLNLFTDINQKGYGLKEVNPYLQESLGVIKGTPDFNTLSNTNEKYTKLLNILQSNNNVKVLSKPGQNYGYGNDLKVFSHLKSIPDPNTNQNYAKLSGVLRYNNSVSAGIYDYLNENINKQYDDLKKPDYQSRNLLIVGKNTKNDKVSNNNVDPAKFGLQQLIYNKNLLTNIPEDGRNQLPQIANQNILSKLQETGSNSFYIRNPVDNNVNLQSVLSYYIQNPANRLEQDINRQPIVIPKTDSSQEPANDQNISRHLYLYKQLLNQHTQGLGLNRDGQPEVITGTNLPQEPGNDGNISHYLYLYKQLINQNKDLGQNQDYQDRLTVPNTFTSHSGYVSPNVINTNVLDNNKHEVFGTQSHDSSHLPGVSNLIKLNSVPSNNRILELTYKLRRTKAVYEPSYYVKYRIPYNDFLLSLQNVVKQKPYLRNQPNQIYEELLNGSNEIEASGNLKDLNRDELVKLTFTNGTLIDAKVLENDVLKADKQLKMIQDLNANLSYANINLNESSNKPLESIENLLNTTVTSGFDGSLKSNVYPLTDVRRLSMSSSVYNTPNVYQSLNYNYNPYSKSINPAYSSYFVSPGRYTYNTLSKNIVPSSYNLVNGRYVG